MESAATAALAEAGLFPRSIRRTEATELRTLTQWNRNHPALVSFDGRDGGDLTVLQWRDGFDLQPKTDGRLWPRLMEGMC